MQVVYFHLPFYVSSTCMIVPCAVFQGRELYGCGVPSSCGDGNQERHELTLPSQGLVILDAGALKTPLFGYLGG